MIRLGLDGKAKEAYSIHFSVMDMIQYIFEENNPAGIKALLKRRGICEPFTRLPVVEATAGLQEKINTFMDQFES